MNRIYKLIWSKVKNCYVVTSELAKSHTKGCSGKRVGRLLVVGAIVAGLVLPMGEAGAWNGIYTMGYQAYGGENAIGFYNNYNYNNRALIIKYSDGTEDRQFYIRGGSYTEYNSGDGYVSYGDGSQTMGNVTLGNYAQSAERGDMYFNRLQIREEVTEEEYNALSGYQRDNLNGHFFKIDYNDSGIVAADGKLYAAYYPYPDQDGKIETWELNEGNHYTPQTQEDGKMITVTMPSGNNNIAIGSNATATGQSQTAVGHNSSAQGYRSVAIGPDAQTGDTKNNIGWDDGQAAIAIGDGAKAFGNGSTAIGQYSRVDGYSGVAIGSQAGAHATYGIAIGDGATVTYNADAEGVQTKLIAENAIAIGHGSIADGKDATTVGRQSQALMRNATAYGNNAHADAFNSVAIGNKAIAGSQDDTSKGESAVAVGNRATALDEYTTAIGASTFAKGTHSVAVGDSNRALGKYSTAVGAGWSRYDVYEDDNDNTEADRVYTGGVGANQATGDYSTAIGHANAATGDNSVAMGMQNAVSGNNSIGIGTKNIVGSVTKPGDTKELTEKTEKGDVTGFAFGNENEITGNNSIAIGVGNKVSGENSGAIGDPNIVDGKESYVVGNNSTVDSDANESFIMGNSSTASAKRGLIFGNESKVSGEGGIVAGSKSEVSAADSIAIGNNAKATLKNSVALGSGSETTHMGGLDGKKEIEIPGTNTKYTNVTGESPVGTVSVGKPGEERTITNVAAGRVGPGSTDAINGSELYAVEQQVVANSADIVNLSNRIDKVGAGAAALAGLHPLDFDPDEKWHMAAGIGNYGSETAVAIGAFYQPTDDILYNIATTVGDGRNMVSGGVSIRFGQKSHQSRSKKAMAKEIIELREEVAELKALVYDLTGKGGLDPSKTAIFPDTPENHWAYDYVAVLAGNGVLEGYQDGYFRGNRQLTRYEMAAIIYRLMSKGIEVDSRMLQEFAPELARVKVDTLTHYNDGTPHIQRVRIIPQRG